MGKIFDSVAKVLIWLTAFLGALMVLVVTLQILGRYVFQSPIFWTEEVSRILFIAVVTFGSPLAVRSNQFTRVDLFIEWLPGRKKQYLMMGLDAIVAVFLVVVACYSLNLIKVGYIQKSSVLRIPMSYFFSTMLLCPALTAFFFFESVLTRVRGKGENSL
jgi:TRAP-type C4-dicarboxylate transport system permease small subunit